MVLSVDKRKKDKHNNVYHNLRDNIYNKRIDYTPLMGARQINYQVNSNKFTM